MEAHADKAGGAEQRRSGCLSVVAVAAALWLLYALSLYVPTGFNWIKWRLSGVRDYAYTTQQVCLCPPSDTRVTVRGGTVVSAEFTRPDYSYGAPRDELVDAYFSNILACPSYLLLATICVVEYDSQYGFPTLIETRCYLPITDCDSATHLYDFEVLTL